MPRCQAITRQKSQCSRNTLKKYCRQHQSILCLKSYERQLREKQRYIRILTQKLKTAKKKERDQIIVQIDRTNNEISELLDKHVTKVIRKLESVEEVIVNESEKTRIVINENTLWLANGISQGISQLFNQIDNIANREPVKAISFSDKDRTIVVKSHRQEKIWKKRLS